MMLVSIHSKSGERKPKFGISRSTDKTRVKSHQNKGGWPPFIAIPLCKSCAIQIQIL